MTRAAHYLFLAGGFFLWGCVANSYVPRKVGKNVVLEDEEERYELIILDNGFHNWFVTNARPAGFYSPAYYEAKNRQYVSAWNNLYYQTAGQGPFEMPINYDFNIDYGPKLNYQLFWYFKYIESIYGTSYPFPN